MKYKIEEIKNKILCGDALEELQKIPDNSIDCIITSPPYWGLRDYQVEGQIGLEPTLEEYLEKLLKIFAECKRVLKKTGVFFLNWGDCYGSSPAGNKPQNVEQWGEKGDGLYKRLGLRHRQGNSENKPTQKSKSVRQKCLTLQNFRGIIRMIDEQGWILRNVIIWYKCLGGNLPIYAKTGNKIIRTKVKDLARLPLENLYLPTPQGWKKILKIEKQPKSNLLTIHLRSGFKIEVTPEHKFLINGNLVEASKLKKGDKLDHTNLPDEPGTLLGTYENGWIVGLWLAEGNYEMNKKAIRFSLNIKEENLSKKLEEWCKKYAGKYKEYNYGKNKIVVIVGEVPYAIIKHYTSKSGAKYKRLSSNAFIESNNFLKGILKGFLAGDGYYDAKNDRYRFRITTNSDLLEDLRVICNRTGYFMRSKLRKIAIKKLNKTYNTYEIEIKKRKKGHFNQKDDFEILKIIKTNGYSYEIEIEEPHIFILSDGTLTHNSNHLPSSVKDRFTNTYEPVFMLVKSKKYWFDLDSVRIPWKQESIKRLKYPIGLLGDPITRSPLLSGKRVLLNPNKFNYRVRDDEKKSEQCPQFKATKEEVERYKEIEFWLKKLDEGGKQREAKIWFLNWLKEHPNGTYEQFYEEMKSKKVSKYKNEGWSQLQNWESHFKNFVAYLGMPNPLGKNPGDLWRIPTQPAPPEARGKHFAIFPENLIKPMILAGCPREFCKKCGKPRERIIVSLYKGTTIGTEPKKGKILEKVSQLQRTTSGLPFGYTGKTIGWTDCGCGAGFEPGIVLDPFMGSGTVAVVAKKLGRNFIGIELNPEYVKIAEERLKKIPNHLL
jgi:DNA modification methylase